MAWTAARFGLDDDILARGDVGIGATIMGRNMFGPVRGHPVFVLSHHPRESIPMSGGTTFHFVTDGIEAALERAFAAADGADVRVGGGAATIQQYLGAGLIDDSHVVIVPVLLGGGERLFDSLGGPIGYRCVELVSSPSVVHLRLSRMATPAASS